MRASSIDKTKLKSLGETNFMDRWARSAFFKVLENLEGGKLILQEGEDTYIFGEDSDDVDLVARVIVNHPNVYRDMISGGTIGSGESFMKSSWESPDVVNVIRIMVRSMDMLDDLDGDISLLRKIAFFFMQRLNRNSKAGSENNIAAHYDLGNDFFSIFLDRTMMYSAAVFPDDDHTLEDASLAKLDHICQRLQLKPTDHLVEIGTGWGGLAIHAAKEYGCKVTTTTISKEQGDYAKQWVAKEGLSHLITVENKDYRDLTGKYDKLVSIEMIEAVGHKFYESYFTQCSSLLKPNGLMLVQAITISDQRYQTAKKATDFIQRYIFPGGCLPCNSVIANQVAEQTDMQIIGLEDITRDYARTLREWRLTFLDNLDKVRSQGFNETFIKMWEYYLAYCEGGFTERVIHTAQFLIAKPKFRELPAIRVNQLKD